jgi:hypothetical protein
MSGNSQLKGGPLTILLATRWRVRAYPDGCIEDNTEYCKLFSGHAEPVLKKNSK